MVYHLSKPDHCKCCDKFTYYVPGKRKIATYTPIPLSEVTSPTQLGEWVLAGLLPADTDFGTDDTPVYYQSCDYCRGRSERGNALKYQRNLEAREVAEANGRAWCSCKGSSGAITYNLRNRSNQKYKVCDNCVLKGRKGRKAVQDANEQFEKAGIDLRACRVCQHCFPKAAFCTLRHMKSGFSVRSDNGSTCRACSIMCAEHGKIINYLDTLTLARERLRDLLKQPRGQCRGPRCGMLLLVVVLRLLDLFPTNQLDDLLRKLREEQVVDNDSSKECGHCEADDESPSPDVACRATVCLPCGTSTYSFQHQKQLLLLWLTIFCSPSTQN